MAIGYFSGDSRYYIGYTVSLVRQEIDNNRSLFRRVLTMVKASGSGDHSSSAVSYYAAWGPTTIGTDYFSFDFRSYSSLTLIDTQQWVNHNADGTMTGFTSSAQVNADLSTGTPSSRVATASVWVTAPTIPRATTPTVSGGFTTGAASTISLPRASSDFTHDVSWVLGSKSGSIATGVTTSTSWTPGHDVMTELPNSATGNVNIVTVTKNGATTIGTKETLFPITAGAVVVPNVSAVMWDDNNPTVKTNIGAFVQGQSLMKGSVTAAGVYGSTIESKALSIEGQGIPENQVFQVSSPGTVNASGSATDSRGRTGSKAGNFTVLAYQPPSIGVNGWAITRANSSNVVDDNGQYLRVDLHAIAASLKPASVEKNALTISVRTRPTNGAWTNRNTINPGLTHNTAFQVTGGAVYLTTNSYEVEISITDNTGVSPLVLRATIPTAVVTIDLRDNRVGIGKMHEYGALDVNGDIHSSGKFFSGSVDMSTAASITSGTFAAARLPAATETAIGAVELATQAEVNVGTDTTRYVTPATLKGRLDWVQGQIPSSVSVGSGSSSVDPDGRINFTGCSWVAFDDVIDTISNYAIYATINGTTVTSLSTRMRVGGVTQTANLYNYVGHYTRNATGPTRYSVFASSDAGYWNPGLGSSAPTMYSEMLMYAPRTGSQTRHFRLQTNIAASDRFLCEEYGEWAGTTVADGFAIVAAAGTISGQVKIVRLT